MLEVQQIIETLQGIEIELNRLNRTLSKLIDDDKTISIKKNTKPKK